jgi:ABC-type glycerol-3-phosphate transport system substrate-binding protein
MRYRTLLFIPLLVSLAVTAGAQGSTRPASPAAPHATTTITFWHAYSSDSPEVKTINNVLLPRFHRLYPRIRVQAVAVPYDSLHQKLITATAGGTLPDVVRSDIIWVPELAKLGVLVPLDRQLRDFKKLSKVTFPGALSTNKWNGHYYGLPLDTNTRVQMYNQQALAAAGIQQPPKTFAALRNMAARLKEKDVYAFADGGTSGWSVLPWIWSAGGRLTNASLTKATGFLNSAASIRGVQLLVDLHRQGTARFGNVDGGLATSDGLAQGKFATILDGPWMFPIFQGQYPNFRLRTALVPSGGGGSISVVGGEDIVMTTSSKHKGQAASFIRFMLSRFAQLEMAKVGQMTIRTDLRKQMVQIRPYYGIFLEQLKTARARTPHPQWPRIDQTLETYVAKAVKGDLTVQQALTQAARDIDQLLARR